METTSPLFLLLVLFFSVSGVRATVENSEDDFEENNHRVDAEQEPFTKVTLAAKSGDAISTLFQSCLDSSPTFDAKFASIETPGGITYTRYVPDSNMLAIPMQWENAVNSVSDIFGCASVAEAGDYSMFKYSANGCKLAKKGYNLKKVPDCEDNEAEAVFIKPTISESCVAVGLTDTPLCFTDKLMTQDAATSYCTSMDKILYAPFNINVAVVISILNSMRYTTNLWVGATFEAGGWTGYFGIADWVNGAFPTDGSVVAYLDSQADWKLRGGQKSAVAGALCILAYSDPNG